ncbi:MAG: hypothetical protein V2A71_00275 [Candidatus Eisenbacteria bacterium]
MKLFVVVLLVVLLLVSPSVGLGYPAFCDWALESGKVVDWLVCLVFGWFMEAVEPYVFGGGTLYW